ncbi:integrase, catalytic region, zinc finger, CCHC-type containing protein [Tanacetum coccineum]
MTTPRFTWVKFLRSNDETPEFVTNFLKQIEVHLNKTVRFIRTDNGTEFVNQVMSEYYEGVGIFHQKSVPRTPQQNGVVKRRNRTLNLIDFKYVNSTSSPNLCYGYTLSMDHKSKLMNIADVPEKQARYLQRDIVRSGRWMFKNAFPFLNGDLQEEVLVSSHLKD